MGQKSAFSMAVNSPSIKTMRQNVEAFLEFLELHKMPVSICKSMDLLAIPEHFKAQGVKFNLNGDASIKTKVGTELEQHLFGCINLFSPYGDCEFDMLISKHKSANALQLLRARFAHLLTTY